MTPYLTDPDVTLHQGDSLEVLRSMPDASVHMACTSPPFFGLRDYGTGTWEGGDEGCDHMRQSSVSRESSGLDGATATQGGTYAWGAECGRCGARRIDSQIGLESSPDEWAARLVDVFREVRRVLRDDGTLWVECGDSYAASSKGSGGDGATSGLNAKRADDGTFAEDRHAHPVKDVQRYDLASMSLKPKDLIGQPWLLAFALRADGWYLRSCIIWAKPNAMPESVTDRPTTGHSYVFLFSKKPRYMYDAEALREPYQESTLERNRYTRQVAVRQSDGSSGGASYLSSKAGGERVFIGPTKEDQWNESNPTSALFAEPNGINESSGMKESESGASPTSRTETATPAIQNLPTIPPESPRGPDGRRQTRVTAGSASIQHRDGERWPSTGKNARSVWEIATEPNALAICRVCDAYWQGGAPREHCGEPVVQHFAAFPRELVRRMILAGTSERGVCAECGAPWVREVEVERGGPSTVSGRLEQGGREYAAHHVGGPSGKTGGSDTRGLPSAKVVHLDWIPSCGCWMCSVHGTLPDGAACGRCERSPRQPPLVPATVLDPFSGSGTTLLVARSLGRHAVGIELNERYCAMTRARMSQLSLLSELA